MTNIQISSVGYAVPLFTVGHEMLGVSGLSKYDTFTLILTVSWPAGNGGGLGIIYSNLLYLNFPKLCFAGPGKLVQLMPLQLKHNDSPGFVIMHEAQSQQSKTSGSLNSP